jgi:hypothetical protein
VATTTSYRWSREIGTIIQAVADAWMGYIAQSTQTMAVTLTTDSGWRAIKIAITTGADTAETIWQFKRLASTEKMDALTALQSPGWFANGYARNSAVPARDFDAAWVTSVTDTKRSILSNWCNTVTLGAKVQTTVLSPSNTDKWYTNYYPVSGPFGVVVDADTYVNMETTQAGKLNSALDDWPLISPVGTVAPSGAQFAVDALAQLEAIADNVRDIAAKSATISINHGGAIYNVDSFDVEEP